MVPLHPELFSFETSFSLLTHRIYFCRSSDSKLNVSPLPALGYFFDRRRGYYLLCCSFCTAVIRGQRSFLWKAWRHQLWLDKVGTSETVTIARHCQ